MPGIRNLAAELNELFTGNPHLEARFLAVAPLRAELLSKAKKGDIHLNPHERVQIIGIIRELKRLNKKKTNHQPVETLPIWVPPEVNPIQAEEWWIDKAREDVAFFTHYVSGKEPARHMRIWLANMFKWDRLNIIAPRESAKSHIAVYALAYILGRAPLRTNAILSVSATQAEARLKMLRGIVDTNEGYQNVFPNIHLDNIGKEPDTVEEFSVYSDQDGLSYRQWRTMVERFGSPKDSTVFASGIGGKSIIGRRWSGLLLLDDIIDETVGTDEAQKKVYRYLMRTLVPCVTEEGRIIAIGTRWMVGDVPGRLKTNKIWKTIEFPAIIYDDDGKPHSYWKSFWSLRKLERRRLEMMEDDDGDTLFRVMYLCDPRATSIGYFTQEMLDREPPELRLEDVKNVWITTDFALSIKQRADFTVFQCVVEDKQGRLFMVAQLRLKAVIEDSLPALYMFADRMALTWHKLTGIIVEHVAFSTTIDVIIRKDGRSDLPVIGVIPKGDKGFRASLTQEWMHRERLFLFQNIRDIDILKMEWLNFDKAPHDDTLDPMGILLQHLGMNAVQAKLHKVRDPLFVSLT